jgi:hypothetical protein
MRRQYANSTEGEVNGKSGFNPAFQMARYCAAENFLRNRIEIKPRQRRCYCLCSLSATALSSVVRLAGTNLRKSQKEQ